MNDYYKILGVSRDASPDEIKRAYHRLAHKYHPDKGGDEKRFKEISEAYQVLSNPDKKAQYDRFGQVFEEKGAGFDWSGMKDFSRGGFDFGGFDLDDLFEEFFGSPVWKQKDLRRGKDIKIDIEIPLEATLKGLEKTISLKKFVICSRCQGTGGEPGTKIKECFTCRGTGSVQQIKRTFFGTITRLVACPECQGDGQKPESPCNVCKGEGRIVAEEAIKIFIPAGVDSNQILKLERRGNSGRRNGRSGDLFIRILVKPHPTFKRKADDLYMPLSLSISQAILGDEIEIPTLERKNIVLKIPAGTESGKIFRVSGKGIPHFSTQKRGNLYVETIIKIPKKLTKRQKELLEKLKEEGV